MIEVVDQYLDKCQKKITEAQEKYGLTDSFHLHLEEDVSPVSIFDSLSLGKEDPKRIEREVIYPLVVFYWDNLRNILELVRINNTMEELYHKVCERAFQFCVTYNRVNEFHILRRLLHKHLDNLMDPLQDQTSMKFRVVWSPATAEKQLRTRFSQLEAACTLKLWSEAFSIIGDIRVITTLPSCKSFLRASYYEKLAEVFWAYEYYFYHAYGLVSLLAINKKQNKEITAEELTALASRVLLAAVCVPVYSIVSVGVCIHS